MLRPLVLAVAVVLSSACVASATTSASPSLRLLGDSPLLVKGSHFHKGERVTVTLQAGGVRQTKQTRASAAGAFTVSADATVLDKCGDLLLVRARGLTGDTASVKRQLPECPPAP